MLDVRSPAEYNHAHIPGAINLPLFTNEERAVVGTAYKQQSREAAIKIGLDYFGPKMRGMVEKVEELVGRGQYAARSNATIVNDPTADRGLPTANSVFLYCWRGGMRSGAVAWLLNLYGFEVTVLAGGYKAYRNEVLQSFQQPYPFTLLGGYTGSGKTELLQALKAAGEKVVDLEALASHKGSAFGNINMPPQPSQEMFENLLSTQLQTVSGEWSVVSKEDGYQQSTTHHLTLTIWLEDESRRIGSISIPLALWSQMQTAPIHFLEIPFEERLKHIVTGYGHCDKEKLLDAIERIRKKLGGLDAQTAAQFLEEGAVEDCFRILLRYYDKLYSKGLQGRENLGSLLQTIHCKTVCINNAMPVLQHNLT